MTEPVQAMPRWQRAYAIATCAIIGAAFAYAACDWGHWPTLQYFPLQERAAFAGDGIAITYYGTVLWGIGGAACGAIVGAVLCAIGRRPWSPRTVQLFGAWSITAILLCGTYYMWNLWPW
ncbi:MAG: hypothetical protein H0T79_14430 [Deltaproteobacteria bacterium]|nr:hypothetical protein [Deltaproteobacteria bacterium]